MIGNAVGRFETVIRDGYWSLRSWRAGRL